MSYYYTYAELHDYVRRARDPVGKGRKLTAAFRLFNRAGAIEICNGARAIARVYPDDIVEFIATPRSVACNGQSLSQNFWKILPLDFIRIATNRYRVKACGPAIGHEYFQYMRVNLKTGEVINPKNMEPVVDTEKRKQWLRGLKAFRLQLRAMARVGALEGKHDRYQYMSIDRLKHISDCIMDGAVTPQAVDILVSATSPWRASGDSSYGEAVIRMFESVVKSNSRELRNMAGVIDIPE